MYAVRALVYLAMLPSDAEPARVEAIAHAQHIPPRFLPQIMATLKAAGMVQSRRGTAGGYSLTRSPGSISLAEVIERFEHGVFGPSPQAENPVEVALKTVADRVDTVLRAATIEELASLASAHVPGYTI